MAIEPSTVGAEGAPLAGQDAPLISVIIPHYNDLAILERCMGLLAAQTLPRSQFEVVVADNNSRCGLNEVKRVCGGTARVVPAPFQRAGAARNAAVEAPRGRVLAFIDSDCRPTPAWLERGLAALSSAQIVGGQVDVDYEDPAHPTAVEAFERVFAFNFKRYIEKLGFPVPATCSCRGRSSIASAAFAGRSPRIWTGASGRLPPTIASTRWLSLSGATDLARAYPEMEEILARSVCRGYREAAWTRRVVSPECRCPRFAIRPLDRDRPFKQAGQFGAAVEGDRGPFRHPLLALHRV